MIPDFTSQGLLPPFTAGETNRQGRSPYFASIDEVVEKFAFSPRRCTILAGLLNYRSALLAAGMNAGFQWLSGSFVEKRDPDAPNDVDVVVFHGLDAVAESAFLASHRDLVDSRKTKAAFKVDVYLVSLLQHPGRTVLDTVYWFGLLGHQRNTARWKGMVAVHLPINASSDDGARALLATRAP